jgi:hypothetical protein
MLSCRRRRRFENTSMIAGGGKSSRGNWPIRTEGMFTRSFLGKYGSFGNKELVRHDFGSLRLMRCRYTLIKTSSLPSIQLNSMITEMTSQNCAIFPPPDNGRMRQLARYQH